MIPEFRAKGKLSTVKFGPENLHYNKRRGEKRRGEKHLSCFQIPAIVKSATMKIGVKSMIHYCVFVWLG